MCKDFCARYKVFDTEDQSCVHLTCTLGIAGSLQCSRSAPALGGREVSFKQS